MKKDTKILYAIVNENGDVVGDIHLEKRWFKIISDMLRIYPKYSLKKL